MLELDHQVIAVLVLDVQVDHVGHPPDLSSRVRATVGNVYFGATPDISLVEHPEPADALSTQVALTDELTDTVW